MVGKEFYLNTQGQCRGTAFTQREQYSYTNTQALQLMDSVQQL